MATQHNGVRSGGTNDARDVGEYHGLGDIHHDTHQRALEHHLAQPNVKLLDKSMHPLSPVLDALSVGEEVIVELNDGRHKGKVLADLCSVEELEGGSFTKHVSGTTLDERVYRVSYVISEGAINHGAHGGAGGGHPGKEKVALFKRSDLKRARDIIEKEGTLGLGPYSQSSVPKEGRFMANSTQRRSPTRK